MSDEAIPEDIEKIAYEAWYQASTAPHHKQVLVIARAILAERERCHKIACDMEDRDNYDIARAIRTPSTRPGASDGDEVARQAETG